MPSSTPRSSASMAPRAACRRPPPGRPAAIDWTVQGRVPGGFGQRPRQGGAGEWRLAARPRRAGGAGDGRGGTLGRCDPRQARCGWRDRPGADRTRHRPRRQDRGARQMGPGTGRHHGHHCRPAPGAGRALRPRHQAAGHALGRYPRHRADRQAGNPRHAERHRPRCRGRLGEGPASPDAPRRGQPGRRGGATPSQSGCRPGWAHRSDGKAAKRLRARRAR